MLKEHTIPQNIFLKVFIYPQSVVSSSPRADKGVKILIKIILVEYAQNFTYPQYSIFLIKDRLRDIVL